MSRLKWENTGAMNVRMPRRVRNAKGEDLPAGRRAGFYRPGKAGFNRRAFMTGGILEPSRMAPFRQAGNCEYNR